MSSAQLPRSKPATTNTIASVTTEVCRRADTAPYPIRSTATMGSNQPLTLTPSRVDELAGQPSPTIRPAASYSGD